VAILGLSYKPDTNVVEESQGVMLANRLASDGCAVTVFDPAALDQASTFLAPSVQTTRSTGDCLRSADLAVIAVPWPEFRDIPTLLAALPRRRRVLVDCWRLLDRRHLEGIAELVYIGAAPANDPITAATGIVQHNER
jgi:UDPglucose 6-dehydrogenase